MSASRGVAALESGDAQKTYSAGYQNDWVAEYYDEVVYAPSSYDSFVWSLQQPLLARLVRALCQGRAGFEHLDFACGTGRVLAGLADLPVQSTGLDLSQTMLSHACAHAPRATLVHGDLLANPTIAGSGYDLITAFRFFLNTEPEMRRRIMAVLASRLRDRSSRLIFNVHGNTWSLYQLESLRRASRGQGYKPTMAYRDVRTLVEDAGLEIEAWYGVALLPRRLHRTKLAPLMQRIERNVARSQRLRGISQDLLFVCRQRA